MPVRSLRIASTKFNKQFESSGTPWSGQELNCKCVIEWVSLL